MYKLRLNYIQNFGNFRKYGKTIMRAFMVAALKDMGRTSWRAFSLDMVGDILGIEDLPNNLEKLNDFTVEKVALAMLMTYSDRDDACTWQASWQADGYHYIYQPNDKLSAWYAFLVEIGYQPSEEEINFMCGNVNHVEKKEAA